MNRSAKQLNIVALLMFALIFNAMSSTAMAGVAGENGVLLCTSQGYKWLNVDKSSDKSNKIQKHCQLCLAPQGDTSDDNILFAAVLLKSQFAAHNGLSFSHVYIRPHHNVYQLAQGRAPPALS